VAFLKIFWIRDKTLLKLAFLPLFLGMGFGAERLRHFKQKMFARDYKIAGYLAQRREESLGFARLSGKRRGGCAGGQSASRGSCGVQNTFFGNRDFLRTACRGLRYVISFSIMTTSRLSLFCAAL
jgi:hypothetical protein